MKKVKGIYRAPHQHWVGDGFPVRSLFSYQSHGKQLSPFLLLDYAGPMEFTATKLRRGVGQHPHRGFETVTIVYHGEVEHRDSTGKGGVIGPGDVQWMTAGSGILHEEFHSDTFAQQGGAFEMVQLWVNLPAKDKMAAPGYQAIGSERIPQVALPEGAGSLRVIAGSYADASGPAHTFSPLNVWDIRLNQDKSAEFSLPVGWNSALIVLRGSVLVNGDALARDAEMVLLDSAGSHVTIEANNDAVLLLLSGEPIDEPIIGYGPFVMNTQQQITEAIADFNGGRFGSMNTHS
ncbi:pirin family protein [Yersinia pekkanenii]|uniref:Pirin family protein n=1 Tax=Yersinia pekkanenii TaxID=1288385 RepID=A0A0T9NGJ9_9GAMM|nr:pirin family protein [Yersinia pekkanenii]CNH07332.1 pirin family protein [Yersinia pekkanenii]CRY64578.1 pirin family protein [Yersinia pekkanenii]